MLRMGRFLLLRRSLYGYVGDAMAITWPSGRRSVAKLMGSALRWSLYRLQGIPQSWR